MEKTPVRKAVAAPVQTVTIVPPVEAVTAAKAEKKKDCGCNGAHGSEFEAPEPYTHTDGKEYLFKAYAVFVLGVSYPAKQVFKLAAGETLCDDCLEDYPVLSALITAERTDNGMAKEIVDNLFILKTPLLSVVE